MPAGILHEQSRNVGHVAEHHELSFARAHVIGRVARGMTVGVDRLDARDNLLVVLDRDDHALVLPAREHGLDALCRAGRRARVGPEGILGLRHVDLCVRIDGRVGVLRHQAEDVVGVEVRDDDGVDLGGVDLGSLHVVDHLAGGRRELGAGSGIEHDEVLAGIDDRYREGNRHVGIRQLAGDERLLGIVDRGVLDEAGVVRLLPDAVIEARDLELADGVIVERLDARRRLLLCLGRADEHETLVEAENCRRRGGRQNNVATRNFDHRGVLPSLCFSVGPR